MSEDRQAQAEAWIRKKPRRIIQSQALVVMLMILTVIVPIPLSGLILMLVFCVAPAIVIPSILVVQVVGSVIYIVMRLYVERQNKKS